MSRVAPVSREKLHRMTRDAEVTRYLEALGSEVTALRSLIGSGGGSAPLIPVGGVYISVDPANPSSALGYGTWSALGVGRVLIGVDPADPDFDTVLETGGSKTAAI